MTLTRFLLLGLALALVLLAVLLLVSALQLQPAQRHIDAKRTLSPEGGRTPDVPVILEPAGKPAASAPVPTPESPDPHALGVE